MPTSLLVTFLHLPVELIVKILMKLDTVDLVNMELTCVYVKTIMITHKVYKTRFIFLNNELDHSRLGHFLPLSATDDQISRLGGEIAGFLYDETPYNLQALQEETVRA